MYVSDRSAALRRVSGFVGLANVSGGRCYFHSLLPKSERVHCQLSLAIVEADQFASMFDSHLRITNVSQWGVGRKTHTVVLSLNLQAKLVFSTIVRERHAGISPHQFVANVPYMRCCCHRVSQKGDFILPKVRSNSKKRV